MVTADLLTYRFLFVLDYTFLAEGNIQFLDILLHPAGCERAADGEHDFDAV